MMKEEVEGVEERERGGERREEEGGERLGGAGKAWSSWMEREGMLGQGRGQNRESRQEHGRQSQKTTTRIEDGVEREGRDMPQRLQDGEE